MKKLVGILTIMVVASLLLTGCPKATPAAAKEVKITLWTKEGEADNALQFVKALCDAYHAQHENVTFEVVNKDVETLREDFQTASLAGMPPDLLWTVNDHAGPFTTADIIQPVDNLFDLSKYVDSAVAAVKLNGKTWGVPIANGNHLMLLYNKDLIAEAPKDTDELFAKGKELASGEQYGLVWNQTEPFWLVPWLGGFGGAVFAEDGKTPTLNTPEMVATLKFLHDMKYDAKIIPPESDYNGADTLFKEGKAAMIINGDWSLGGYKDILGDKLGVAPIPKVTATGQWPKPYTSGVFFMLPKGLSGDKLEVVKDFITFVTNKDNQLEMVRKLTRLPALKEALSDPLIASDPILKGSAEQMTYGTPMPTVVEMRCNWDAMKPEMQAVLADTKTPQDAAAAMQAAAEACIAALE
ncbi:MAG: extracellular solute-binding protein [Anaerolineae bacterium]|jgi:arabinogalactan oligomer/maltooligosaccharide transport system substrate-binding protein|nr:extracellular solute-binding protein [Anaerolineae bacterium]MDH7473517.1 extracellular solute-binding protein [Anaerolineae bacterium]